MMKLLQFFLIVWMSVIIDSKNLDKKLSLDGCDHDGWKVMNISITSIDDKINFTANIINSTHEQNSSSSDPVKLSLTGCNNNLTCTNLINLSTQNVNCTINNTEIEREKCTVMKIIEDWTRESNNLKILRENKNPRNGCILYEAMSSTTKQPTTQKIERKINGTITGFILDPLVKHASINPSIIF